MALPGLDPLAALLTPAASGDYRLTFDMVGVLECRVGHRRHRRWLSFVISNVASPRAPQVWGYAAWFVLA